jgi:hypothetical protein
MAAGYVPRLRARSTEHGAWSMERRAGSGEKAQKMKIEHRTPNSQRTTGQNLVSRIGIVELKEQVWFALGDREGIQ